MGVSVVDGPPNGLKVGLLYEPRHDKNCFCHMQTTKAQISLSIRTVWSASLFVHCMDSIIPLVSISEISSLYLASLAAQAGLCLTWSQTPKTVFLVTRLIPYHVEAGTTKMDQQVASCNHRLYRDFAKWCWFLKVWVLLSLFDGKNWKHFDGVFKDSLSGILWHSCFRK